MGSILKGFGGKNSGGLDPAGIFPDNAFRPGGLQTRSVLSTDQEQLLHLLSQWIPKQLDFGQDASDSLLQSLTRSTSGEAKAQAGTIFQDALLDPSLYAYNRDVAPKIAGDFANIGGTLSSRRTQTLNQGRVDVIRGAQSSLAGILPQIEAYPLQQTLAQIQGLGALQTARFAPFQQAAGFATAPTRQNLDESAGPGYGILSSVIGIL